MRQFRLEQREIHVGGAFGCAPFARETIAQCGIQFRRTQGIVSVDAHFQRGADYVGAAARRHDFLVGGHKRWAHDPDPFKTAAAAVALFQIADERMVFECEREHGLEGKLQRSREVFAQMIVDSVVDGLPQPRDPYLKNFPGLKMFFGSNVRLISRITPSSSSPSWSRMYSVRAIPTPCSAESEPLNCRTSAEVSSATRRNFFRSFALCRSSTGRTCKSPLAACQ